REGALTGGAAICYTENAKLPAACADFPFFRFFFPPWRHSIHAVHSTAPAIRAVPASHGLGRPKTGPLSRQDPADRAGLWRILGGQRSRASSQPAGDRLVIWRDTAGAHERASPGAAWRGGSDSHGFSLANQAARRQGLAFRTGASG